MGTDGALKREFAKRLTAALNDHGWNGSELARRASKYHEVTRDNISSYCNGKALPGPAKLAAIAKALGVDTPAILPHRRSESSLPAPTQMRDLGNGNAHLNIDRVVPMKLALDVLQMLERGIPSKDNDDGREDHRPARKRVSGQR